MGTTIAFVASKQSRTMRKLADRDRLRFENPMIGACIELTGAEEAVVGLFAADGRGMNETQTRSQATERRDIDLDLPVQVLQGFRGLLVAVAELVKLECDSTAKFIKSSIF